MNAKVFTRCTRWSCVVGFLLISGCWRGSIIQPIQFNHLLHTEEVGLECTDCHQYVRRAEFAGRPTEDICAECHEEPLTESAEEALLIEYIQAGEPVPWKRLYDVPDHVYYSHRRHVTVADLDCSVCHGEIGRSDKPPPRPLKELKMERCIGCHEQQAASTDCNSCHR